MEIKLTITNRDDIDWINSLSIETKEDQLRKIITIGRSFLCSTNLTIKDEITDKLDIINKNITSFNNSFTTMSSKSASKGRFGEVLVADTIKQIFSPPNYQLVDVSKSDHEGDFHLFCPQNYKILIEVKTYSTTVNKSQIEKLYNDINYTDVDAAIMVSTTSDIVGHPYMDWELVLSSNGKECLVIYVSNAGINGAGAIIAIRFVLEMQKYKKQYKKNIDATTFERLINRFFSMTTEIEDVLNQFNKNRQQMQLLRQEINNSFDKIYMASFDTQIKIKNILDSLKSELENEFVKVLKLDIEIEKTCDERDIIEFLSIIDQSKSNGNTKCQLSKFFSVVYDYIKDRRGKDFFVQITDFNWTIVDKENKLLLKTNINSKKNTFEVMLPIFNGNNIDIIVGRDTIREFVDGNLLVSNILMLKDEDIVYSLKTWLN